MYSFTLLSPLQLHFSGNVGGKMQVNIPGITAGAAHTTAPVTIIPDTTIWKNTQNLCIKL